MSSLLIARSRLAEAGASASLPEASRLVLSHHGIRAPSSLMSSSVMSISNAWSPAL